MLTLDAFTAPLGPVDLSVAEAGRGGRPLLLVHGFTGAKEDFGDWLGRFADAGWWAVAPDLRGHGASSQPREETAYSLATFADDLEALAVHLGWERFSLLGHSMGGMIAQELVLRPRHHVDRLVLMDTHHGPVTFLEPDLVAAGVEAIRANGLHALLDLLEAVPAERAPSELRLAASRPGYDSWGREKTRRCSGAMYAAMGTELTTRVDRLVDLAHLDVPTRVVVGVEDRDFLEPSARLAAAIPGADLVEILDAAHSPQFENPEGWWDAVAGFLRG